MVTNVEVVLLPANSVRVSWKRTKIPQNAYTISSYAVYYRPTGNRKRQSEEDEEKFVTVHNSVNSTVIEGLMHDLEYQFQVVVIAEVDRGAVVMGDRSLVARIVVLPIPATSSLSEFFKTYFMTHNYIVLYSVPGTRNWRCNGIHCTCCHCCSGIGVCSASFQKVDIFSLTVYMVISHFV